MQYLVCRESYLSESIFENDHWNHQFYLIQHSRLEIQLVKLLVDIKRRLDIITYINLREKETLEQQVTRPACSNTSNQNQPIQKHGVLLDD